MEAKKEKKTNQVRYDLVCLMGIFLIIIGIFMPMVVVKDLALIFSAWFMIPGMFFGIIGAVKL